MYSFICLNTLYKNTKSINDNNVLQGGSKQVRFQPLYGKLLGTSTGNNLKIFDVEADKVVYNLKVT
jgi:hypothetical protein